MKIKLRCDIGDGPFEVSTNLWIITQWERRFKRKVSQINEGLGIEDLAFMAHLGAQDAGVLVPISLDDFIKKLVTLDVVEDPEDMIDRPTDAAPTAAL